MLMLRDPDEFVIAVDALLAAQEKSLQTCCAAGGEHLCFIGMWEEIQQLKVNCK